MKLESLPEYTVRISSRAKRPALRIVPGPRLEVVIPKKFGSSAALSIAESLVRKNEQWIKKHCRRMGIEASPKELTLPNSFLIRGGTQSVALRKLPLADPSFNQNTITHKITDKERGISVNYLESEKLFNISDTDQDESTGTALYIPAHLIDDPLQIDTGRALLRHWVKNKAKRHFSELLEQLAAGGGFDYTGPSVRINKSRWGSCSAKKNIMVNACALFLPDPLIKHLLIHELCHTREMNHQEGFWREMFRLDPDALKHEKRLRNGWRHVPGWMLS